jgi:hypothetical protein
MRSATDAIMAVMVVLIGILVLSFLLSFPLMLLWNGCLVPAVSVLNEVGWLQMWGISVLIGVMFKNSDTAKKN